MESIDDFLAEVETRVNVVNSTPISEPLTQEEESELADFALERIRNMSSSTDVAQEESTQFEVIQESELEPEPEDTTPQEERVVDVPDYTNVREETTRFSGADWFKKVQEQTVILAGVGGIGSNMAIILAKLNPKALYLFDGDTVETVNLAGQFYSAEDVGEYKVDAIAQSIVKYTNYSSVFACNRFYTEDDPIVGNIMVCGFDNMRARKDYFNTWKKHVESQSEDKKKECLFIDGRLTANEFQIICMTGEDEYYMEEYNRRFLFKAWEAERVNCSFKQTGYLADMIGAFMVNLLVNFCANLSSPARNMPLPFFTSYRADVMYLNTEV